MGANKSQGAPLQSISFILIVWHWINLSQEGIPLYVFLSQQFLWLTVDPEAFSRKNPSKKRAVRNSLRAGMAETH